MSALKVPQVGRGRSVTYTLSAIRFETLRQATVKSAFKIN